MSQHLFRPFPRGRQSGRSPLASALRIARALFISQYALMLEFRAEILLWALSGVMPLLMFSLWSSAPAGAAAGISPQAFARYFLAAFVVRQFTVVWVVYAFEEDNLLGRLSPLLLQPLPLVWRYAAAHLAEQATRLPFVMVMVALFFLAVPEAVWIPSPSRLLLALLAAHLGFWLNFLLQHAITMLCFWSERASALERFLFMPYLFLSGMLAPLDLYPEAVRRFALLTPFPSMLYVPAQLASGGAIDALAAFRTVALWLAVLIPLNLLLWRAGVRRYAAMGG
jgi:ABC-2 type transport system permease protein